MSSSRIRTVLEARVVTGAGGGPDKTILNTPRFLADRGYPTVCAYLRPPNDSGFAELERRARLWQAPLEAVDDRGPFDWRVAGRMSEVCRRHDVAIWHGHDYKSNLLGLHLGRRRPMLLVTTVHGWVKRTWKIPLYYALDRWSLRRYAAVVCVSRDLHEECLTLGVKPDRCHFVPNGVDAEEFWRRRTVLEARGADGAAEGRLVVGAVGRMSHEKGFDLLLHAAAALVRSGRDLELRLAGDGDELPTLRALARDLGIADRVRFAGFQADVPSFLEGLDAFVLSSRREGLPNSVLEAMSCETPVLATRVAGVPDLIQDGENGLLADSESVDSLQQGLRRMADPALRRRLAAAGRSTIVENYSLARRMDRIKEIYDAAWERERRP